MSSDVEIWVCEDIRKLIEGIVESSEDKMSD